MKAKALAGKIIIFLMAVLFLSGCGEKAAKLEKHPKPVFVAEGIRRVSIIENAEKTLDIAYEPKEHESSYEYWKIHVPYGESAIVDTEAMLAFFHKLENLDMEAVSEYPEGIEEELQKPKSKIILEYCLAGKEESNSYKANADSIATLFISDRADEDAYYAAYEEAPGTIYRIPKNDMDGILKLNAFQFILKISAVAPIDTVEQVRIKMDGNAYEWNPKKEKDHGLYKELLGILIKEEVKEPKQREREPLLEIQFVRNKRDMPELAVEYLDYDNLYASVLVNGAENFLVDKKEVELLKEKIKMHYK